MSINPFLNSIVHPYAHVVNITHSMEGNFDFMKSGQDSVIPEENISNEDIASVAAPFVVYMQKALEVCDVYVLHCGRSVIRPEDIARCLAYTARDFQNMLRLDSVRQNVCSTYVDILHELDEPDTPFGAEDEAEVEDEDENGVSDEGGASDEDESDVSEEDKPSEEFLKAMFKKCVQELYPQLRNAGKDTSEAATWAIQLARRGYESEHAELFCESQCPCQLCVRTNERFASWSVWDPQTREEQSIQKAVQHIIDQLK